MFRLSFYIIASTLISLPIFAFQVSNTTSTPTDSFTLNSQEYIEVNGIWYTNYRGTDTPGDLVFPASVIAKHPSDLGEFPATSTLNQAGLTVQNQKKIGWGLYLYKLADEDAGFAAATLLADLGYLVSLDAQASVSSTGAQDPYFHEQWSLESNQECFSSDNYFETDINVRQAWNLTRGNSDVIVGIIDNGFYVDHPDLRENLWLNEAEVNGVDGHDDDGNGLSRLGFSR